jgi:hypothetical protein
MEATTSNYIAKALSEMLEVGYSIKLTPRHSCAGEHDAESKSFVVRIKDSIEEWFPNFIHEYCHYLQVKDNKFVGSIWNETLSLLWDWVDGGKAAPPEEKRVLYVNRVRRLELDCEKRVVKEIRKNKLQVNIEEYIQKANSYIFSHNFLAENKPELYQSGVYGREEAYSLMPRRFLSRYDRMPQKYRQAVERLTKGE